MVVTATDSIEQFEDEVERLMAARPRSERGKVYMRHLRLCRPDIAAKIQGTFCDPSVTAAHLERARKRTREEWDTDASGNESHADH